ncbi:MAG: LysR family transcriptional regulator [Anaerolineales bacterium]|nr:LysR family transcriptional regulator [Anaerolineales bacterium]
MPSDLPNINDLKVFLVACETKNFSQAGRQLHLSQPAISQTINNLEKHFGTKLFLRQGRSIYLTEIGQALRPMARELVAAARRMEESVFSLQGEVVGEFEIGCSTASGKYLLPGLIARYRRIFPLVRINVLVSSRNSIIKKLISGEVALGISSRRIDHRELEYQDFFTDEVILIVPANHPWAKFRRVFPDDLLDEPMILREESAGTIEVLKKGLLEHDISFDMLNVAMGLGNAEAIEIAVEEGIGVAFISRLAAKRGLEMGKIVEVEVESMSLFRKIYLARNQRFPSTRAQSEFWDFVLQPEVDLIDQVSELLPDPVES